MASYNGAKYIKSQIDSILSQIGPEDELIISDDMSTDSTVDIISSFHDPRIKLLNYTRNKKGLLPINLVTTNFENALRHAKGDIIFLCDQDDVWTQDKIKVSLRYLIEEGYDYIVSDCYVTDKDLNITADTRFDGSITLNRWKALVSPTPYQGSCAAFKRAVLNKSLPFPDGIQSHDRWIGFIASFSFKYRILSEKLIYYRRHETTASTATSASTSSKKYKINTRLKYMFELIKRLVFEEILPIGGGKYLIINGSIIVIVKTDNYVNAASTAA